MTLKEKFNNLVPKEFGGMYEPLLSDCEKVADDYAIEFAEWLNSNCYRCFDNDWWLTKKEGDVKKTSKELLEIFKKEKGL